METHREFGSAPPSLLPRLVSEDNGRTWRVADVKDEERDDLVWDSVFAPPESEHLPKAFWDLERTLSWP
jgi:hypothetical protein